MTMAWRVDAIRPARGVESRRRAYVLGISREAIDEPSSHLEQKSNVRLNGRISPGSRALVEIYSPRIIAFEASACALKLYMTGFREKMSSPYQAAKRRSRSRGCRSSTGRRAFRLFAIIAATRHLSNKTPRRRESSASEK